MFFVFCYEDVLLLSKFLYCFVYQSLKKTTTTKKTTVNCFADTAIFANRESAVHCGAAEGQRNKKTPPTSSS